MPEQFVQRGLSSEMLRAAIDRLADTPMPIPCGSPGRPHVVHPKVVGWTLCANCTYPLHIGPRS